MTLNYYEYTKINNSKLPSSWQSQSSLDALEDFLQQNWEQRSVFYNDQEIDTHQQFIKFLGHQNIKTNKYIGTIMFKGEQLNIYPRVFKTEKDDYDTDDLSQNHLMNNLIRWIEYCNKMEYPFLNISSELNDAEDLKELFITLYISYVRSAIERGLYYKYVDETNDCKSIKGKFDLKDYITNKIPNGQSDKFKCTYSNFEFNNQVNQIIKCTCKLLYNLTSKKNQKTIRTILTRLSEIDDVNCVPSDCDNIRLNRLNSNYGIIVSMSKMFLLNKVSNYTLDSNDSFCFLFPTDYLFEGFVGGFIKDELSEYGATVRLQESNMSLVNTVEFGEEVRELDFKMRHDILVEMEDMVFILDTKYKELSRFEGNEEFHREIKDEVDQKDLYQVTSYAVKRDISDVYLLYPMYRYEEAEKEFPRSPLHVEHNGEDRIINIHFVRLPFVFEKEEGATRDNLKRIIKKLLIQ